MPDYRTETPLNKPTIPEASYVPMRDEPTGDPSTGVVSFLSSNERQGSWQLPRRMRALAVLGNIELDLREAEIGFGVSVIEAVSVLGNIEVTVPPDVAVECEGDALLGNFTVQYEGRVNTSLANRDRTIRITGNAYLASVTVKVKGPDEDMLARLGRTFGRHRR
jgi:hypothetical protein